MSAIILLFLGGCTMARTEVYGASGKKLVSVTRPFWGPDVSASQAPDGTMTVQLGHRAWGVAGEAVDVVGVLAKQYMETALARQMATMDAAKN
jgi:hypothetical protein